MNKKNIIITALLALVALTGQSQVKCHIEGELSDTTKGKTIIICPSDVDIRVSDNYMTTKADEQGRFSCDVEDSQMRLYEVFLHEEWQHGSWSVEKFLIENGATVSVRFDGKRWKTVSGGPEQMQKVKIDEEAERLYLAEMNEMTRQAETDIFSRIEEMKAQGKNPQEDTLLMKQYREFIEKYEKMFLEYRAWEREYYATHPMLYVLYDIADGMQYAGKHSEQDELMQLYHKAYENFRPENPIHNTILTLEAGAQLKPGNPYIDFEARTVNGELVRVAPLYQGKVAVIDLWASWCSPCRQHSIDLIPVYEKYKDLGFTVVAIAHEDKVSSMTKAAKKDGYPWPSLIDLKDELKVWRKNGLGFSGGGMYLVDRDGTILSTSTDIDELEPLIRKALGLPELAPSDWKAEAEQNRVEKDPEKPFTDFSVVYQGKTTRLSDYVGRGQYVLVDFWASWCAPCLEEVPNLIAAYHKYKGKGLQVVGVAVSDKPAHTERAIKEHRIDYPQIINAQDIADKAYGIRSIPRIFLFAPDGTIVASDLRGEDIEKKLAEIFE